MTIEFRCTQCNQLLRVPDTSAGKNARCPKCKLLMQIPSGDSQLNIPPPSVSAPASPSGGFNLQSASSPNPYASPRGGQEYQESSGAKPGKRPGLPWEKARKKNVTAFMETAKLVSFEPSKAFSQMQQRGDMGGPMLYSGIGMGIGMLGMELWNMLLMFLLFSSFGLPPEALGGLLVSMTISTIVSLVIGVPISATLGNFIGGGILHICLLICGGSKHPFDTSFRISCYVQASLGWLMLIPGGVLIMGFWSLAVGIIAVHKAHEVPMGRAVLTVLLPLIVLIMLGVILVVVFGAALAALLSQQR